MFSGTDVQLKKKGGFSWCIQHKERLGSSLWRDTSFANIDSELPKAQLAAAAIFHIIWLYQDEFGSS